MEDREAKSIIEAILFIAAEPLTVDSLKNILEMDKVEVERLVKELVSDYMINNTGLLIAEVAEGVQMATNPACAPWVKKLLSTAVPTKLSQPSLETLAIIAYKQPIIKAEIEAIRGVNSDGVVKTLLERKLIKLLGRKEVPGRPLMYGTTKEFLQYFGLKDLTELPTLKEFQEFEVPEAPEYLPEGVETQETFAEEEYDSMVPDDPALSETQPAEETEGGAEQFTEEQAADEAAPQEEK
ncbi:MAG: SMC-Scp complex subunit ScpB [Nitrospirae bacterium]|nr:SMC-Scp complex subunit ScpB [Nitrospirota bacterium]